MAAETIGNFTITVPGKPKETDFTGRRSALFVPKDSLVNVGFSPSEKNSHVMVTRNPGALLDIVSSQRQFGSRDDSEAWKALENDPNSQQVIVYTLIKKGENVLLYRRATKGEGDKRLSGNASVGFGGHTSVEDVSDIVFLEEKESGEFGEVRREDGSLKRGVVRELTEELGLEMGDVDLKVLGAFYEEYSSDELKNSDKIPVGAVHTCIIAVAQLNDHVAQVKLQEDEIGEARWVKAEDLPSAIEALKKDGVTVENWTDISINEFEDLLELDSNPSEKLPEIVINNS